MRSVLLAALTATSLACTSAEPADGPAPPRPMPWLTSSTPLTPEAVVDTEGEEPASDAEPASSEADDLTGSPEVVGWVAGTPVTATELLAEWNAVAGRELFLIVEKVVTTRLATAEARRLELKIAPEEVELRVTRERQRALLEVERQGKTLEEFLAERLGIDVQTWEERMRRAALQQMIAERVVRAWTLGNEWARIRLIAVAEEAQADSVMAALAAGDDFSSLARERSLDDSSDQGGLVPFLVRREGEPLALEVFSSSPGDVLGPFDVGAGYVIVEIEALHAPRQGNWAAVGEEVEASLREFPVGDPEFLEWKLTIEAEYPIDLEPLRTRLGLRESP